MVLSVNESKSKNSSEVVSTLISVVEEIGRVDGFKSC